jgi:hypothetical protein
MKTLFYRIYCFFFLTSWGTMLFGMLSFIAGLVGASETGALAKILFIGVVWFGGFILWAVGDMNKWRSKYFDEL